MSWYKDPFRHSLASKGVKTNFSVSKRDALDDLKRVAVEMGDAPTMKEYEEKGRYSPSTIVAKAPKTMGDRGWDSALKAADVKSVNKQDKDYDDILVKGGIRKLPFAAKKSFSAFQDEFRDRFFIYSQEFSDPELVKSRLMSEFGLSRPEVEDMLQDEGVMRFAYKRKKSMAYKFIDDGAGDPVEFVHNNLKATGDHSVGDFWSGVKYTLFHPWKDADGEWVEYNVAAGKNNVLLSKDKFERAEQRAAAISARVLTQANVESLLEKGKDRSFRQIITELEFGRRTGDEKEDERLIKDHLEK